MHDIGFPLSFFAFPLNVILALIWSAFVVWMWRNHRKSMFVTMMLSKGATLWGIAIFLVFCLVIGLTGKRELVYTWPSVIFLLYFQTVLFFVILRGWRNPAGIRWRFLLNHIGLLVTLMAAFWGAPDTEILRTQVFRDGPSDQAYTMEGTRSRLPYQVQLLEFDVETFDTQILIDGEPVSLKVNSPYSRTLAENLYVVSYEQGYYRDQPAYCVLQIVRQPWKYAIVAGIIMMLCGALLMFAAGPVGTSMEEE